MLKFPPQWRKTPWIPAHRGLPARRRLAHDQLARQVVAKQGQANNWGSYYDTQPIVAAGKIKSALQRMNAQA